MRQLQHDLDAGEAEAIALALEMGASRVLIDEHRGRQFATRAGLKVVGLLGVLAEAKQQGLVIACKPLLDRIIAEAGFWIGDRLYAEYLTRVNE